MKTTARFFSGLLAGAITLIVGEKGLAAPRPPLPPLPDASALYYEGFDEPYITDQVDSEVTVPGIGNYEESWSGYALQRSGTDVTAFVIPASGGGETNIASDTTGALRFWVRPYWSTGDGPGIFAPLLTFYAVADGQAVLCSWLEVSPDGSAITLVNQTDAGPQTLLSAAIDWQAGQSYLVTLDFASSGAALFLGDQLAAQGNTMTLVAPAAGELALGSDIAGDATAGADFDEFYSFAAPLTQGQLTAYCVLTTNQAALEPLPDGGLGSQGVSQMSSIRSTNSVYDPNTAAPCNPGGPVYFTNFTATAQTNGSMAVSFVVNGGVEGVFYDVYQITDLGGVLDLENWVWVGQVLTCNAYTFSNQPAGQAFYKLVQPTLTTVWAWGVNDDGQCNVPASLTNAVAVAGGTNFSLALTANGTIVAWGANNHGQTSVPAGLSNVLAIAAGDYHGMALLTNGAVVEWGSYCNGMTTFTSVPSNAPYSNLVAIAGSIGHDIGLTRSNTVVTWGMTGDPANFVPPGVTNVAGFTAVGCGWEYNAALFSNGVVKAWGYTNDNRVYGYLNVPAWLTNVAALVVGPEHSLAITNGGRVVSWGFDSFNQTNVPGGLSNVVAGAISSDQSTILFASGAVQSWGDTNSVEGLPPTNMTGVKAIAAGFQHGLAISSTALQPLSVEPDPAYALAGKNFTFSLAGVTDTNLHYQWQFDGTNIAGATNATYTVSNAVAADDGTYTVTISNSSGQATRSGVLALAQPPQVTLTTPTGSGTVWYNTNLIVTVGVTNVGQSVYPPVYQWQFAGTNIPGATNTAFVIPPDGSYEGALNVVITNAAGTTNVTWALRYAVGGLAENWGDNTYGESSRPLTLTNVAAIAAGDFDSVALTDSGTVAQWGEYWDGAYFYALGSAPTNNNLVTVAASRGHSIAVTSSGAVITWGLSGDPANYVPSGLAPVSSVAAGWNHNLALLTNGSVGAWGDNTYGQTNVPANLATANAATAVAAGCLHSLALRGNGTVEAWGYNAYGQTNVPSNLTNVVAIAGGAYHSLALQSNGCVVAWGMNTYGQCNVPAAASNNVMAIAGGAYFSMALKNDGTLVEWGDNGWGESSVPVLATNTFGTDLDQFPPQILKPSLIVTKLIAAGGLHAMAAVFSPLVQYPVNPTNDLLVIYNVNSADSSNVCKYYLLNRPKVSSANVLGVNCTTAEVFSPPDFTNYFLNDLSNWLALNPTKRPLYVVLFQDIPSRVDWITTYGVYISGTNECPSVQYQINAWGYAPWRPFVTAINMKESGGTTDSIAYINKIISVASNSPSGIFVSAHLASYENTNWVFDDSISNIVQNGTNAEFGYYAEQGVLAAQPTAHVAYSLNDVIVRATNVAGYYSRGCHNGVWTTNALWPIKGLVFTNQRPWFLMVTDESYSGAWYPSGTSTFFDWFTTNSFGGFNYSCTPIGAATHVDEPGVIEFDTETLFDLWASGKSLAISAWNSYYYGVYWSLSTPYPQVVGDPFVRW